MNKICDFVQKPNEPVFIISDKKAVVPQMYSGVVTE
jgi:hypothetical protein